MRTRPHIIDFVLPQKRRAAVNRAIVGDLDALRDTNMETVCQNASSSVFNNLNIKGATTVFSQVLDMVLFMILLASCKKSFCLFCLFCPSSICLPVFVSLFLFSSSNHCYHIPFLAIYSIIKQLLIMCKNLPHLRSVLPNMWEYLIGPDTIWDIST